MVRYVSDPATDMHRDVAMQLFSLPKKEVSKLSRYIAKNGFTFPQFYGSYYADCAKNIWNQIDLLKIKTESGMPLLKWLKKKGITKLGNTDKDLPHFSSEPGSFVDRVQEVENDFWNNRFKVYKQWKWDWYTKYLEQGGWFRMLTGFVCQGLMDRKQVCNYPVQGSAFHHVLWSLIQLQNTMEKKKMRSRAIAEIHDSILGYFHKREVDDVLVLAKQIMTQDARKHWKCINVPITIEASLAPEGGTWYDTKKVEIPVQ
jgi:hypothetical protein